MFSKKHNKTFAIGMISPLSQVNVAEVVVGAVVVELAVVVLGEGGGQTSSSPDEQSSIPSHTCVPYKYRKQKRPKRGLS